MLRIINLNLSVISILLDTGSERTLPPNDGGQRRATMDENCGTKTQSARPLQQPGSAIRSPRSSGLGARTRWRPDGWRGGWLRRQVDPHRLLFRAYSPGVVVLIWAETDGCAARWPRRRHRTRGFRFWLLVVLFHQLVAAERKRSPMSAEGCDRTCRGCPIHPALFDRTGALIRCIDWLTA